MGVTEERQKDRHKAALMSKVIAEQVMEHLDICDKEHKNYSSYLIDLQQNIFSTIVKTLNL